MSTVFKIDGLAELSEALRRLPAQLAQEASGIVQGHAMRFANEVIAAYPIGPAGRFRTSKRTRQRSPITPGTLKRGVKVDPVQTSGFGTVARVRSTARHAYIFEYGTQARHNDLGAYRGSMPPGKVFVPRAVRTRRAMLDDLIRLVESEGLQVTGR